MPGTGPNRRLALHAVCQFVIWCRHAPAPGWPFKVIAMTLINAIRMGGAEILPLVEGGKGVAISNGVTAGHWALSGGAGTFSAVNADSYDKDGSIIPQLYHGRTRRDRHEELVAYGIEGGVAQAQRAWDISGGKG